MRVVDYCAIIARNVSIDSWDWWVVAARDCDLVYFILISNIEFMPVIVVHGRKTS